MNRSIPFTLLLVLLLITLNPLPGHAHKVRIFAWEEGGTIQTESVFSGGRPARNAQISVTSAGDGKQLLTGKTDKDGLFSFPVPETAKEHQYNLEITINSGDGHKNSWRLDAADYLGASGNSPAAAPVQPAALISSKSSAPAAAPAPVQKTDKPCALDEQQLGKLIESVLDKQLGPIRRSLAEQQDKGVSLQDILSGIGYILGLAGITAYFKSQGKQ